MFNKNKLKPFDKFLEKEKISYLNSIIKNCGYKKIKMKSYFNVNNQFGLKTNIDLNNLREIVLSSSKKIDQKKYDTKLFNEAINLYIVYYRFDKLLSSENFTQYIKYIQENMINFPNCDIAIFLYKDSIYSINKKIHNGIETFVEFFKWKNKD